MTSTASSLLDKKCTKSTNYFIHSVTKRLDKHIFKLNKSTENKKYWICTIKGCIAKIHTHGNNEFIKIINDHTHLADEKICPTN
jgi:hypothetical protein